MQDPRTSPSPAALHRRRLFGMGIAGGAIAGLGGCATPERGPAIPRGKAGQASVLGVPNERFYPSFDTSALEAEFLAAVRRQQQTLGPSPDAALPTLQLLSISGGGENGAFGAGLLNGWTLHGDRPIFSLVTGVSTGALTAPFAFLGSAYDAQLKAVYTELTPASVLERRYLTAALFDDALTDNLPLFMTISRYLDAEMMAAIAQGYDEGRLLLIGTSDLDAQQPVIWNIGAIAKSGHPKAVDTVRRILLSSAAIPGVFPPTMFDVTLDGKPYQEMHVDGGAFAQAFLYPPAVLRQRQERLRRGERVLSANAYIIRNGRLDAEWATVERRTLGIVGRAISTMIATSGYNDVLKMYASTQRDRIGFNLAAIGPDFTKELPEPFEPGFMRALYVYGFAQGRAGYAWAHKPPLF